MGVRCIDEVMEYEMDELMIFGIGHSNGVDLGCLGWDHIRFIIEA
jgi:hypothetical protein